MKSKIAQVGSLFLDFFEITIICTAVFAIVYFFVGQLLKVTGDSMFPTLKNNEQIVAEKLSIKWQDPKRGEIMVFKHPSEPSRLLIKRVIAVPGDILSLSQGKVFLNGEQLEEPYLQPNVVTKGGTIIEVGNKYSVPTGEYVFFGDNREQSSDSRFFNTIKKENIIGRAFAVYYPFNEVKLIN